MAAMTRGFVTLGFDDAAVSAQPTSAAPYRPFSKIFELR